MEWPARSPDLNPIEHLWDYLGREVAALNPPPRSLHELKQGLLCVWSSLLFRCLRAIIFQQDNKLSHVARRVLTYLETKSVRLLFWSTRSSCLSSMELKYGYGLLTDYAATPVTTIDEVWHRLEKECNDLPLFAVQEIELNS
ncbi:DDE_3 domain-containing protein [Trichonephila clavipes]|uniref:DDE_3 domain-containing protein n=1 Tax=Trichonephila clavipes TaxID=2585209 RepID=A0A8X7BIG4_TRICX|nr:DDE_3 domain-containing protein [Trichonephila clavipes]